MAKRKKLPSETNTPAIEREVESDFQYAEGVGAYGHEGTAVFEHGQWWVTCPCGAQWSVVDTSDGFGFEQVSEGEEDFHDERYRNARGIQNFRWGPCPYCGASGWETAATRGRAIRDHDRPQGGRCLQARKGLTPNVPHRKSCGFAISVGDQMIQSMAHDFVEEHGVPKAFKKLVEADGTITPAGWEKLTRDVLKVESNALAWLRKTFLGARDDGHDTAGDLVGSLFYDPSDTRQ